MKLGLLVLSLAICTQAHADTLTFKQALQYALDHSPAIEAAKHTRDIAELEATSAGAKLLPSLDAAATQGLQGTSSTGFPSGSLTSALSVTLSETLWDNGQSWTQREIARISSESAQLTFGRTRDRVLLAIVDEYYKYSLATQLVIVRQEQLETLHKQFREIQGQYQQGLRTRQDYLRFKLQVERAEFDQMAAKDSVQRSITELLKLIGAGFAGNERELLSFAPVLPSRTPPELPQMALALANTAEAKLTKLSERVNELNESLVTRKRWPELTLSGEGSYAKTGYLGAGSTSLWSWNATVGLRYNLWDWGIRRRDAEGAAKKRLSLSADLRRELLELDTKLRALQLEFAKVRGNLKLSLELLDLSEKSFEEMREQYRQGRYSFLDLIDSLRESLDAQVRYYSAYFDALQAQAQYRYYEGTLYEALLK